MSRTDVPQRPTGQAAVRRRARWARLGLAAVVVAGGFVVAPVAGAWTSSTFQSPTGNIRCRYDSYNSVVACRTGNDGLVAAVSLWGRPYATRGGTFPSGPTLYYGETWTVNRKFRCWSRYEGMTCKSVQSGRGFFTSRSTWRAL